MKYSSSQNFKANIRELPMTGNTEFARFSSSRTKRPSQIRWPLSSRRAVIGFRLLTQRKKAIDVIAGWEPDVAIVDVMLPVMNGFDFSIILKANYPACRLMLFSGEPDTAPC